MKLWPKNDAPARFEDLTKQVIDAIRFAYKLERKNRNRDIPVSGTDVPKSRVHWSRLGRLTSKRLKYAEDELDREALEEIVAFAIELGIEQGRRIERSENKFKLKIFSCTFVDK